MLYQLWVAGEVELGRKDVEVLCLVYPARKASWVQQPQVQKAMEAYSFQVWQEVKVKEFRLQVVGEEGCGEVVKDIEFQVFG